MSLANVISSQVVVSRFNYELLDNLKCAQVMQSSEEPTRALFSDDMPFSWAGWHHEHEDPSVAPGDTLYGLYGVSYSSTPGSPHGQDDGEPESSILRSGALSCTIRFPRSAGIFPLVLCVASQVQMSCDELDDDDIEFKLGISTQWIDALDQFEQRLIQIPFLAGC